ncbi:DNRLRE domain-containing protein [Peribacillus muralis]|uniref:DNRLRE domain-containing protein n=1 Tax=Peribacillus muralis TaxID=264697 RepID=UPI0038264101
MRKFTSLLIALVLLFTTFPYSVFGEENVPQNQPSNDEGIAIGSEIKEDRTEYSKTYVANDGQYEKKLYIEPIHVEEDGKWKEISTELIPKDDKVTTERTKLKTTFSDMANEKPFATYETENDTINFTILGAVGNSEEIAPTNSTSKVDGNQIIYPNVFPNVDLRHITLNNEVKEDWILQEYTGVNTFKYKINTTLNPVLEDNGSLSFYKDGNDKPLMSLPKPSMMDSNIDDHSGLSERSDDIEYKITKVDENTYDFELVASTEWLKSPERVYPVYIDPSVTIPALGDTYASSATPTSNLNKEWNSTLGEYVLRVGEYDDTTGTNEAFLKFSVVGDFKGAIIDKAVLSTYVTHAYYVSEKTGLWVDRVDGKWYADELTWSNKPKSSPITSTSVARDEWAKFDVKNTIQSWVNGSKDNFGFKLHANGNGKTHWKKITAAESTNEANLSITYHYPDLEAPKVTAHSLETNIGYLDVSWEPVYGANGYKVAIFNGFEYETFDVGNVTKWSTKGKGIWPNDNQIENEDYTLKHNETGGTELAWDPTPVYKRAYEEDSEYSDYGNNYSYYVRIIADFPKGSSPLSKHARATFPIQQPGSALATAHTLTSSSGFVELDWEPVPFADGYKVSIFNGKDYQEFDVGADTAWSTKEKGIWPTVEEIEAGKFRLHNDGLGTELANDPTPVYKNANKSNTESNYSFKVSAYNKLGSSSSYSDKTNIQIPKDQMYKEDIEKSVDEIPVDHPELNDNDVSGLEKIETNGENTNGGYQQLRNLKILINATRVIWKSVKSYTKKKEVDVENAIEKKYGVSLSKNSDLRKFKLEGYKRKLVLEHGTQSWGMEHILSKHHPKYYTGIGYASKSYNTMLPREFTMSDIENIIITIANYKGNEKKIIDKYNKNENVVLDGYYLDKKYRLVVKKGSVTTLYPKGWNSVDYD